MRCPPAEALILVNNAGVYGPKGLIEDVDWSEWSQAIGINLLGTVLMSCAAILFMRKANPPYGKIINLSGRRGDDFVPAASAPMPRARPRSFA